MFTIVVMKVSDKSQVGDMLIGHHRVLQQQPEEVQAGTHINQHFSPIPSITIFFLKITLWA